MQLESVFGSMTLARLSEFSGTPVATIAAWALSGVASPVPNGVKPKASTPKPSRPARQGDIDVRTPAGRAELDAIVLAEVASHGDTFTTAEAFKIHGKYSPEQLRTSLNRLLARGLIEYQGQARGKSYRAKRKRSG